jgi:hypothetical protein
MDTMDRGPRGKFVVNSKGDVVPALVAPDGTTGEIEIYSPRICELPLPMIGPTSLGEWLMVDVRVAKRVASGTKLYEICQSLGERGVCGVVESTLIIDLLEAKAEDRRFLLDKDNWPRVSELV